MLARMGAARNNAGRARKLAGRVIEGIESEGMLASAAELGINRDHSGLLELNGVQPGDPLAAT